MHLGAEPHPGGSWRSAAGLLQPELTIRLTSWRQLPIRASTIRASIPAGLPSGLNRSVCRNDGGGTGRPGSGRASPTRLPRDQHLAHIAWPAGPVAGGIFREQLVEMGFEQPAGPDEILERENLVGTSRKVMAELPRSITR